jgi:VCBS repeat-containing protein
MKQRAEEDAAKGINTPYSERYALYHDDYDAWLERNALYRTEPVSIGGTVAERVDAIHASLYTFYYDNFPPESDYYHVTFDPLRDTLHVAEIPFDGIEAVNLRVAGTGHLPTGLRELQTYHVVNANEHTFQISQTEDGPPIDISSNFQGAAYAQGTKFQDRMFYDRNVADWDTYAADNIAEARKYGKKVYAWVSPTLRGAGQQFLPEEFFRHQLEVLRPITDGIIVYLASLQTASFHEQHTWWNTLRDFIETLDDPAAKFRVTVASPASLNHPPVAVNDVIATGEDTPYTILATALLANDTDEDNDSLVVNIADGPHHGKLSRLNATEWRYTPDPNFVGSDTFLYQVSDGLSQSNMARVDITVQPHNDPPVAVADSLVVDEDSVLRFLPQDLLRNDSDVESDPLSIVIDQHPRHGSLEVQPDGNFTYRPHQDYSGSDSFTYRANDGQTVSAPASVTLTIQPVNDAPTANPDAFSVANDQSIVFTPSQLLLNDRDVDSTSLRVSNVQGGTHGTLTSQPNGTYHYVPAAGFVGTDTMQYQITDGALASSFAAITINVTPGRPITSDDETSTIEDQPLTLGFGSILSNDENTTAPGYFVQIVRAPLHGQLVTENGSLVYRPTRDFHGVDSFIYRMASETLASNASSVVIQVAPVDDLPVATSDVMRTLFGQSFTFSSRDLLRNDFDVDSHPLSISTIGQPRNGSIRALAGGNWEYTPDVGFTGIDEFTYQVQAGGKLSSATSVRIEVVPPPQSFIFVPIARQEGATLGGSSGSSSGLFDDLNLSANPSSNAQDTSDGGDSDAQDDMTSTPPGVMVPPGADIPMLAVPVDG